MQENYENVPVPLAVRIDNMQAILALANTNEMGMALAIDTVAEGRHNIMVSCVSLLHIACSYGDVEAIQFFVDTGEAIDAVDVLGWTPLHLACHNKNFAVAECLVHNHADVRLTISNGDTPLHLVGWYRGDIDLMRLLLENEADCNAQNIEGITPFHRVCKPSEAEVLQLFVDHGAFVSLPNGQEETPLHIACEHGGRDSIQVLLENGAAQDINKTDLNGQIPLHIACTRTSNPAVISLLCDYGADINRADLTQRTPFHNACKYEGINFNSATYLLDRGANVLLTDNHGHTALWDICAYIGRTACRPFPVELCARLLYFGCEIDIDDVHEEYREEFQESLDIRDEMIARVGHLTKPALHASEVVTIASSAEDIDHTSIIEDGGENVVIEANQVEEDVVVTVNAHQNPPLALFDLDIENVPAAIIAVNAHQTPPLPFLDLDINDLFGLANLDDNA